VESYPGMDGDDTMNPILDALREILQFKTYATIEEISEISERPLSAVIKTMNRNKRLISVNQINGKITKEIVQNELRDELRRSGAFFWRMMTDFGLIYSLEFNGHDDVRKNLTTQTFIEAVGLSFSGYYKYVPDTEENRAILVADKCIFIDDIPIDDRLWKENEDAK